MVSSLVNQYENIIYKNEQEDEFEHGFLLKNNDIFSSTVFNLMSKKSLKTISTLDENLQKIIQKEFEDLSLSVQSRAISLSEKVLENLFNTFDYSMKTLEDKLKTNEELLKQEIQNIQEDEDSRLEKSLNLHHKLQIIKEINKRCSL